MTRRLFSRSKRQFLVYVIIFIWVVFGIVGFLTGTDFTGLAAYSGTLVPAVITYIWGETKRPHEEG